MSIQRGLIAFLAVSALSTAAFAATGSAVADAAMKGDKSAVRTLLREKIDVNAPQPDGATALHWAVYRDDAELVDLLIRSGADVEVRNRDGATPLSLACINANAAIVGRLLDGGAN